MKSHDGYVYILTNGYNNVLYVGVTSDLKGRIHQHKRKEVDGFSKKYNLNKLVYYEVAESIESAIAREKQIKGWLKIKKVKLIENMNPSWRDLYNDI